PGAQSFAAAAAVLKATRAGYAWAALGHSVAGYDAALNYAGQRTQFGKPLARFQIVQDKLVRMLCEITAMQLYCLRIGQLDESDELSDTIAALGKLNNTVKARQVLAEARNLLGGNGILLENHVIRHMTDMETIHTYEGTETIQTLLVGRDITGVRAFVGSPRRLRGHSIGGPLHARPRPALAAAPGGTRDHRRAGSSPSGCS